MENQTRYDLNAAVENWRNELAAQPDFTSDHRRELESHLRDTFASMKKLGLNDDEAFLVASRRTGQLEQLNKEFGKNERVRPAFIKRVLIITSITALLAMLLQTTFLPAYWSQSMLTPQAVMLANWNSYWTGIVQTLFWASLILILCFSLLAFRRRFVLITAFLFCSLTLIRSFVDTERLQRTFQSVNSKGGVWKTQDGTIYHPPDWIHGFWQFFSSYFSIWNPIWFVILILLIASLLSAQNQSTRNPRSKKV